MRLYIPCSRSSLVALLADRGLPGPLAACAVTPALRDWYADGDDEDLEYAAQSRAADLSLALIGADEQPRRMVLAVDVVTEVAVAVDIDPLVGVRAADGIRVLDVAAVLVDGVDAIEAVRAALAALASSDDDLPREVEALDDHALAWFAPEELDAVIADV